MALEECRACILKVCPNSSDAFRTVGFFGRSKLLWNNALAVNKSQLVRTVAGVPRSRSPIIATTIAAIIPAFIGTIIAIIIATFILTMFDAIIVTIIVTMIVITNMISIVTIIAIVLVAAACNQPYTLDYGSFCSYGL